MNLDMNAAAALCGLLIALSMISAPDHEMLSAEKQAWYALTQEGGAIDPEIARLLGIHERP